MSRRALGSHMRERRVVVVGAGVSGCVCAAALAESGSSVTLINPALDRVGELSFGALVSQGVEEAWVEEAVLAGLPICVADAWETAMLGDEESGIRVVDRRLLSIETKRAMESVEGVELRQGLVVGLDCVGVSAEGGACDGLEGAAKAVRVETAFGETIWGDAAVLAVGLSLGGTVESGGVSVGAGKYGQPASGGLEGCLRGAGARMEVTEVSVGPLVGSGGGSSERTQTRTREGLQAAGDGSSGGGVAVPLRRVGRGDLVSGTGGPPSPYDREELWERGESAVLRAGAVPVPMEWPDGLATGERGIAADVGESVRSGWVVGEVSESDAVKTRPGYIVRGSVVTGLLEGGRLQSWGGRKEPPVWVTGRAGGASGYLESLVAGARTGRGVAKALGCLEAGEDCVG